MGLRVRLLSVLVSLGVIAGVAVWAVPGPSKAQSSRHQVPESMEQIRLSFAPVVRRVAPAVVNVYAKRRVVERSPMMSLFSDRFFRRFMQGEGFGMPRERIQSSLGSGVIVRSEGIIVTNNHVIEGGDELTVVLADRREFDAEVLVADERTDLAVLRIDTGQERLPSVEFRDSDTVEVGELVLALGNPLGIGQTVTNGIVSAVARTQIGISDFRFFIQTDAAINVGNSGGALVTTDGKLIGINTAILSRGSGGSIGLGFAIPANMVRLVVDSAVTGGKIMRPWFGAGYQPVTSDIAESLGLDRPGGALITQIFPGGPAERAGLRSGDVILNVGEFEVLDPEGLRYRIATQKPGERVQVRYWRDRRARNTTASVTEPPNTPAANETTLGGTSPLAGATVVNLSPAFNTENGLDPFETGVAISGIASRTLASRTQLRTGDIILGINGERTTSVRDLQSAISQQTRVWVIDMKRGGRTAQLRYRL